MGAYTGACALLPKPLNDMALQYGYSPDNLMILNGDEAGLRRDYPQIWDNLQSCRHQRDRRTVMEYAQDLVASWLVEDYFIHLLQDAGCAITAAGADRERRVLPSSSVSTSSDFQVQIHGKGLSVEFMCDYTGYWQRSGRIDLRDEKYRNLKRDGAVFLGVDAQGHKAVLLDFRSDPPPAEYIPSYKPYGYKPAYRIPCPEEAMFPLTADGLAQALSRLD